jgi:NCS1 family nucleobase:cation symporter-1
MILFWILTNTLLDGQGTSAARAGVFFVALGFGTTAMFENVCSNAVAGGIDLSGLFPR